MVATSEGDGKGEDVFLHVSLPSSFLFACGVCQIHNKFSMKTLSVLVWTEGLNASKRMRFQTETRLCGRGLNLVFSVGYLVRQSSIHVWRGSQAVSVRRIFWPVFCIPGFFRGKKTLFDNEVINSQSFSSFKKMLKIKLLSKYENRSSIFPF